VVAALQATQLVGNFIHRISATSYHCLELLPFRLKEAMPYKLKQIGHSAATVSLSMNAVNDVDLYPSLKFEASLQPLHEGENSTVSWLETTAINALLKSINKLATFWGGLELNVQFS